MKFINRKASVISVLLIIALACFVSEVNCKAKLERVNPRQQSISEFWSDTAWTVVSLMTGYRTESQEQSNS